MTKAGVNVMSQDFGPGEGASVDVERTSWSLGAVERSRSHSAARKAAYRADGRWRDRTWADALNAELERDSTRILVIDGEVSLDVAGLNQYARAAAGWMRAAGIGRGDVVTIMLPNWWEAFVIDMAAAMVGAVTSVIVPIYRDAETRFILRDSESKAVFIPQSFRQFDYLAMLNRLRTDLPILAAVVVVRGEGGICFDEALRHQPIEPDVEVSPDDVRLLMYTSGTTGRPKGVLHSSNTLGCEVDTALGGFEIGLGDVMLMPSPVTHITGYVYGILITFLAGMTTVLMERWEPKQAVRLIDAHGVSVLMAATPFLKELAEASVAAGSKLPSLRIFPCGGAPVPPETVRQGIAAFERCAVFRLYGSTEAPTVTLGTLERLSDVAAETDGFVVGYDIKIVDDAGRPVAPGQEGEVLVRGPEVMLGYRYEEDDVAAFDQEGFFRMGDLGWVRPDGALVISGRKKDLIIRGGENLSAKEIEDALLQHPDVEDVAVIGVPDERLGETVCACVVAASGRQVALASLCDHLDRMGLAKQKLPQHLMIVQELPRTAAGKVQKFVLKTMAVDP